MRQPLGFPVVPTNLGQVLPNIRAEEIRTRSVQHVCYISWKYRVDFGIIHTSDNYLDRHVMDINRQIPERVVCMGLRRHNNKFR